MDPNYIPPSSLPTMTGHPSALPLLSNAPTLPPTGSVINTSRPMVSPVANIVTEESTPDYISPRAIQLSTSDSANPPSAASELPDDSNKDENPSALSQTTIIAISLVVCVMSLRKISR